MSGIKEMNSRDVIEKIAKEKYGAVKIAEGSYLIPANIVKSNEVNSSFEDNSMYQDITLREALRNVKAEQGEHISVSCKNILPTGEKIIEVINVSKDDVKVVEVNVNHKLDHYGRQDLLNLIANEINVNNILLTFYVHYNYELLERLVKS